MEYFLIFIFIFLEFLLISRIYKRKLEDEKEKEIKKQILSFISYLISGLEAGFSFRKLVLSYEGEPKEFFEKIRNLEKTLGIEEAFLFVTKNERSKTLRKLGVYYYLRKDSLEKFYENLKREIELEEEKEINKQTKLTTINLSLTGIIPFLLIFILIEFDTLLGFKLEFFSLFLIFGLLFPFLKIFLYVSK
jgi:hypothetical protein